MFKSTKDTTRKATCTRCGKAITKAFGGGMWKLDDATESTACKTGFYHRVGGQR